MLFDVAYVAHIHTVWNIFITLVNNLLAINGLDITATDDEAQDFVLGLYETSSVTFDNLRAWLGENTKAL